jgi:hypothetical protein
MNTRLDRTHLSLAAGVLLCVALIVAMVLV